MEEPPFIYIYGEYIDYEDAFSHVFVYLCICVTHAAVISYNLLNIELAQINGVLSLCLASHQCVLVYKL